VRRRPHRDRGRRLSFFSSVLPTEDDSSSERFRHAPCASPPRRRQGQLSSPRAKDTTINLILLVDDEVASRQAVRIALLAEGYVVETAGDGVEALAKLDTLEPDLVLSDVVMPRMSGFALLRELRGNHQRRAVPVILLTSLQDGSDRVEGYRLGADDFVTKPVDVEELFVRVRNVLARRGAMSEIAGSLDGLGLASLLGVLDHDRREGLLRIWRGAERAQLGLRDGRIVSARLAGRDDLVGPACVYELLSWREGSFEFSTEIVVDTDAIGRSTTSLLLEGARLLDEAGRPSDANERG
jgi:DNA-binding response OmpR family regulator